MSLQNLKLLRKMYNLSQADMANRLKIGFNTYRNKENGKTSFTLNEAHKVSKIFKMPIEEIFFGNLVFKRNTNEEEN